MTQINETRRLQRGAAEAEEIARGCSRGNFARETRVLPPAVAASAFLRSLSVFIGPASRSGPSYLAGKSILRNYRIITTAGYYAPNADSD